MLKPRSYLTAIGFWLIAFCGYQSGVTTCEPIYECKLPGGRFERTLVRDHFWFMHWSLSYFWRKAASIHLRQEVLTALETISVIGLPGTPITPTDREEDWPARRPGHRDQYMSMDSESANHTEGGQALRSIRLSRGKYRRPDTKVDRFKYACIVPDAPEYTRDSSCESPWIIFIVWRSKWCFSTMCQLSEDSEQGNSGPINRPLFGNTIL